jgi:transposase
VDVTQIPGLEENALPLFSEVGRDLGKWPTSGHFASWLNLCPDNDISAGKTLWRGMRAVESRAGHIFRLAASSLHHSPTPMGTYLRRMKAKLGPAGAITATAHKIAIIFYTIVKTKLNTTKQSGRPETLNERRDWKQGSSGKPNRYKLVPIEHQPAA